MAVFTRDFFSSPRDDAGVFIDGFGEALMTLVAMQDRVGVTVAEAAMAFNTTPEVVREAAGGAAWISVEGPDDDPTKQRLELDGE